MVVNRWLVKRLCREEICYATSQTRKSNGSSEGGRATGITGVGRARANDVGVGRLISR